MSAKKWLLALGCLLSAVLLGIVLWRLDWHEFAAGLRGLRYEWLAVVVALTVAGIAVRTLRWRLAAGPACGPFRAFWSAATLGLMINQLYPMRAGEIFRIFAIRHLAQVPLGRAALSAFVDRLADLVILAVSALLVIASHTGMAHAGRLAAGSLTLVLVALVGLVAFARGERLWLRWIRAWSARMSERLQERIERFYSEAIATTARLASPATVAGMLLLTAGCFCLDFAAAYCALRAFGWDLPLISAVTVLVFLSVGSTLPSGPGYAGVYQVACIFALALFGIGESQAVAYSIVLQLTLLLTISAQSAWVALAHLDELRLARGAMSRLK